MVTEDMRPETTDLCCPNCGGGPLRSIYEVGNIPAHSCLLMAHPNEATEYPRGDLQLGYCQLCGFLSNIRFDTALSHYSPLYEETQHFSPRFNQFASELCQRLIRDYDLRGKEILEIGCGKGEFLAMLCEMADARGIGIDPTCVPERLSQDANRRVRFIRDLYDERYSHLQGDIVCCRHTLEHIHQTREFVEMLRRSIGDRRETLVFFEVPDVVRVLEECAFWDIYYEHCSYFSPGSFARLFRQRGFEVIELVRDYGDQYLWLMARPADRPTESHLDLEDDLAELGRQVELFERRAVEAIDGWRRRVAALAAAGSHPICWGAGSKCVAFLTSLAVTNEIEYVVDINPYKQGKFLPGTGHPVMGPEHLRQAPSQAVLVMNPIYCDEIQKTLESLGVTAELIPVC
jgi:SAM-dependent methyltransferase